MTMVTKAQKASKKIHLGMSKYFWQLHAWDHSTFAWSRYLLENKLFYYIYALVIRAASKMKLNPKLETEPKVTRNWPKTDSKLTRIWLETDTKLTQNWLEIDLKLTRNWLETDLKLTWNWLEIDTKLTQNW